MITFYMHIPKTGCTTLQAWLERLYGSDGLLPWNPQKLWNLNRIRRELTSLLAERPGV
jgi:hypothetical protein